MGWSAHQDCQVRLSVLHQRLLLAAEKRHPQKYAQDRTTPAGEYAFHSFACTLSVPHHEFHLYLVAKNPRGYTIRADR